MIAHHNWLIERGYRFHGRTLLHPESDLYQLRTKLAMGDNEPLFINVQVYDLSEQYPDMPKGMRYEVDTQLSGYTPVTVNISAFTMFDRNLRELLPRVEQYIIELNEHYKQFWDNGE